MGRRRRDIQNTPRAKASTEVAEVSTEVRYSGPLPSAAEFSRYNSVVPGAAHRILKMAEEYAQHQQNIETKALRYKRNAHIISTISGLMVVSMSLALSLYGLWIGSDTFAISIGTTTVISLAVVFVVGKLPAWSGKQPPENPKESQLE